VNKAIRIIQSYLIFALPFVIACMTWSTLHSESEILKNASFLTKATWEALSWNLMFWFIILILFLILLVAVPSAREKTLKRLANLKERDEREQYITGKAARATYISTLSLMILFLFCSVFTLNIYRAPESQAINGKRGTVSIGLHFALLDESKTEKISENQVLFESKDIPLSKSAIILIFLSWQLLSFNLTARKELIREP
jgi:hypothetical protein